LEYYGFDVCYEMCNLIKALSIVGLTVVSQYVSVVPVFKAPILTGSGTTGDLIISFILVVVSNLLIF